MRLLAPALAACLVFPLCVSAQSTTSDSAYHALQHRGAIHMGVDQYTSEHRFTDMTDGGRIRLERNRADSAGVATIRQHMQAIARAFTASDFTIPGLVHDGPVPGTAVMTRLRADIRYEYHPLPGGGEVRILTRNPEARAAIHEFLAFQRREHHAGS